VLHVVSNHIACIWCLYLAPIFGAYIWSLYLEPILIWSLNLEPISGAYIWCLCCWIGIGGVVARLFWSLYSEPIFWSLYLVPLLVPLFGAFIWSLFLEPIFGAYIWSLLRWRAWCFFVVVEICSKAPNKGTKWCLYLVPSWIGALLSGAFLKIRCSGRGIGKSPPPPCPVGAAGMCGQPLFCSAGICAARAKYCPA
jgi:hypothetical protein